MIDELKTKLTTAYMMFVFDFSDLEQISKKAIDDKLPCPLKDLFSNQKVSDKARKILKDDFRKALAIYFSKFQTSDGFDYSSLSKLIEAKEPILIRHVGKDRTAYLKLMVSLMKSLDSRPRKGLLAS